MYLWDIKYHILCKNTIWHDSFQCNPPRTSCLIFEGDFLQMNVFGQCMFEMRYLCIKLWDINNFGIILKLNTCLFQKCNNMQTHFVVQVTGFGILGHIWGPNNPTKEPFAPVFVPETCGCQKLQLSFYPETISQWNGLPAILVRALHLPWILSVVFEGLLCKATPCSFHSVLAFCFYILTY